MEPGARIADVERVLPHRGSMRMVERVLEWDAETISVEVRVPVDSIFHVRGGVPAHVGIEYMAQAVACWAGCQARLRGDAPPLGFLLGSRKYESRVALYPSGTRLRVEARRELMGDNGLAVFACRILHGSEEMASANISVFEPGDAQAWLDSDA
ncbi:MAG: hotdog family protein [Xanthomonadales bacterium]|nr:hotdog family protein [Xanthomonadales bacterium]